jgi:hypothetical protein
MAEFLNLSQQNQNLVFHNLNSCFTGSNFVAPIFLSELALQRLKDGASKEDLLAEFKKYLRENCNTIVDW